MIQVSNLTAQALQPGQSLTFNNVVFRSGCNECFNRLLPTSVKLRNRGDYVVTFNGNITGAAAAALQIAISLEGQAIPTTAMNAVPAAEGDLVNVSSEAPIRVCCDDVNRVGIINTGAVPVTIAPNSTLTVKRRS